MFANLNSIRWLIQMLVQHSFSLLADAYILQNVTAWFYQKTSHFTENQQKPSCVSIKNWSETYEGAELAQNRGQIWTQHAQKPL